MSRREIREQRERISRAIADYRNFSLTIEAAAEAAGVTVEGFKLLLQVEQAADWHDYDENNEENEGGY